MPDHLTVIGDSITYDASTDIGRVGFIAQGVRKERTGVHATVSIVYRGYDKPLVLSYSNINIDKADQRRTLAKEAFDNGGKIFKESYPLLEIRRDLDRFCLGVWPAFLTTIKVEKSYGKITEIKHIVKPYVIEGGGTIIYGPPGRGKSYVAILVALLVHAGNNILWPVERRNTLFINLERSSSSVENRIATIKKAMLAQSDEHIYTLNARGLSLADIKEKAELEVRKNNIEFVVLDSISRTGYGTLVEDKPTNLIIDTLSKLCPTWLAIAHSPKSDDSTIYGSVMWQAGMDIGVQVITEVEDDRMGVGLKITKANDGKLDKHPYVLRFDFDESGLYAIQPAQKGEYPGIENYGLDDTVLKIKAHLDEVGKDYTRSIAEAVGEKETTVSNILNRDSRFIKLPKEGRLQMWGLKSLRKDDPSVPF